MTHRSDLPALPTAKRPLAVSFVTWLFVFIGLSLFYSSIARFTKFQAWGQPHQLAWGIGLVAVGVWYILDGIGLWRLRRWSRIPAIISAAGLTVIVFVVMSRMKGIPATFLAQKSWSDKTGFIWAYVLWIYLLASPVVILTRPRVIRAFQGHRKTNAPGEDA